MVVMTPIGPPNLDNCPENGKIKSESIMKDNRKYFLDLKENIHGRYLRVIIEVNININEKHIIHFRSPNTISFMMEDEAR